MEKCRPFAKAQRAMRSVFVYVGIRVSRAAHKYTHMFVDGFSSISNHFRILIFRMSATNYWWSYRKSIWNHTDPISNAMGATAMSQYKNNSVDIELDESHVTYWIWIQRVGFAFTSYKIAFTHCTEQYKTKFCETNNGKFSASLPRRGKRLYFSYANFPAIRSRNKGFERADQRHFLNLTHTSQDCANCGAFIYRELNCVYEYFPTRICALLFDYYSH